MARLDQLVQLLPYYYARRGTFNAPNIRTADEWLEPVAKEFDEIDVEIQKILNSRSIDLAEGHGLDMLATRVGLRRVPGETDEWLRERIRFWIYVQESSGTLEDIRTIVSWYIGIARMDSGWQSSIKPHVKVHRNRLPWWPYQDVEGVGKNLWGAVVVEIPWSLVDLWMGDGWVIGDKLGDFPWQPGVNSGRRVLHGHHLLLALVDLVEAVAPAGCKAMVWGSGWRVGGRSGEFPWQPYTQSDMRASGPADVRVTNLDDELDLVGATEGCLRLNRTSAVPYVAEGGPPNQIYGDNAGKKVFIYTVGANGGGVRLWP